MEGHVDIGKVSRMLWDKAVFVTALESFAHAHGVDRLKQHAKNEGKVVRMMPALMQQEPKL